ncbi:MAG: hypothetical protein ACREEM_05205 [Blastocatellia bacterium]
MSSQDVPQSQSDARACELIRRARQAMSGEAGFAGIQTFRVSGKYRRTVKYASVQSPTKVVEKERRLSGRVEIEIALPDKFRKRVKGESMRGFGYSYAEIVNGGEAWRDPPLRPISSNRDGRVIDVGDVERTEWMSAMSAKHQLSYYALGFLLQPLPGFPLVMSYAGEYQESDGKVDVVLAQNGGGFRALLLLDPKTRLLKALALRFVESVPQLVMVETAGFFDRRFMQETFARARRERQARAKPPREYELQLRFSDHRLVSGLQLPHRVTTTLNGEVVEEMTIGEFELNRPINPKRFLRKTE